MTTEPPASESVALPVPRDGMHRPDTAPTHRPDTDNRPDSDNRPDTDNRPDSDNRPDTDNRPDSDNRPDTDNRPDSDNRPDTDNRPDSDNRPDTDNRPDSDNRPDTDNGPDRARLLFRYLGGDEWRGYRAILGVFAGTFFAEFTPEEVAAKPAVTRAGLDPATVADRLESLRRWGNLTVSSSVGNPSSIEDYYRRRNRYLITRSGQEVFELVEGVLSTVDSIADVQAGRLRDLHRSLLVLGEHAAAGCDRVPAEDLTDAVRTVFDLHERFTTELTQFFADLNLWQSRYDLNVDEVQLFAGVLVSYVSEQLAEIERMAQPIARSLEAILPQLATLLGALRSSLAARVDDAGLADRVAVRRLPGTEAEDWEHLAEWFVAPAGRASRLDRLTRQAVAAVRTLTANVTRLSRVGLGAASRRADFLRLAGFFDGVSTSAGAHRIAAAAFGLGSCRRLGALSADADDPVPAVTAWQDAPRAVVPVSLRERGDTAQRGSATPIRDRRRERGLMQRDRELKRVARETTAAELLSCADAEGLIDGAEMSVAGLCMVRDLISRSGHNDGAHAKVRTAAESGVLCTVRRVDGARTVVECPEGRLVMHGLVVAVTRAETQVGTPSNGSTSNTDPIHNTAIASDTVGAPSNGSTANTIASDTVGAPSNGSTANTIASDTVGAPSNGSTANTIASDTVGAPSNGSTANTIASDTVGAPSNGSTASATTSQRTPASERAATGGANVTWRPRSAPRRARWTSERATTEVPT